MCVVGIDPGITSAVAILDLEGNLVDVKSGKQFSKSRMIEFISKNGKPVLVGADVNPVPSSVKRVASSFSIKAVPPKENLLSKEKEFMTEDFENILNNHELDALSGAIIALNSIKSTYKKVVEKLKGKFGKDEIEEIFLRVLNENLNVQMVLEKMGKEKSPEANKVVRNNYECKKTDLKKALERLEKSLNLKDKKIVHLQEYISELKEELKFFRKKRKSIDISAFRREIQSLKSSIGTKNSEIDHLMSVLELINKGWKLIEIISSEKELSETDNEIVFVKGITTKNISKSIKFIISEENITDVPVISPKMLELLFLENYVLISPFSHKKILEAQNSGFSSWLNLYKWKRKNEKEIYGKTIV